MLNDLLGFTPLHMAVFEEKLETIKLILAAGADIESKSSDLGETPLHIAAKKNDPSIIRLLLNSGANIEAKSNYMETPLSLAVKRKRFQVAKVLLDAGANPNAHSLVHDSLLHSAACWDRIVMIPLLVTHGADLDLTDRHGRTPLQMIVESQLDRAAGRRDFLCIGGDRYDVMTELVALGASLEGISDDAWDNGAIVEAIEQSCWCGRASFVATAGSIAGKIDRQARRDKEGRRREICKPPPSFLWVAE